MGATMFGGSVFADTTLEAVQTLANQNNRQIADLTGRVSKLETASSDATQNTKDIATNKDNIAKNAGDIATNKDNIAANKTAIDKNAGDIAAVSGTVTALQQDSESVKKAAELINGKTEEIKNVDQYVKKVDGYEGRLTTVEAVSTNNSASIGTINDGAIVKKLSQNTEDSSKNVTIGTNLNLLDVAVAKNQDDIATNKDNIAANKTAIDKNAGDIATNKDNIAANQKAIDKNTGDIATNKDNIAANQKAIDKNAGDIATNKDNIAANQKAIDKNAGDIATNKDNIAANKTAIGTNADNIAVNKKAIADEATTRDKADQNLQNQINNNSTSINDLYGRYSSLKTDINKVGARSAALAGLHPLDFDPANKLNFAVASGSFKGENSVALGAFYRPNENVMFSAASTMGDSDNAYTFGLSFKIGPSSAKTKTTSPDAEELYKVVGELQDQLAAQQKEIEQLKADKAK